MPLLRFPDGFVWGTATAAHQVEGGNWNNDWWAWEHDPTSPCVEPSGDACDHYWRYPADIVLLADLGFTSYRFSIEWSRIEPEEGEFSRAALDHYKRMAERCREVGLDAVVTFHHFTTPRWVAADGGWVDPATAARFERFVAVSAGHLGEVIDRACTINEPNIVSTFGYLTGMFPPGEQSAEQRLAANETFVTAHRKAVDAIRDAAPGVPVGLTLAMWEWTAVDGADDVVEELRQPMEDVFLEATEGDDFVGVQTYSRNRVGPGGLLGPEPGHETTIMGYEYRPEALEATIRYAHRKTGIPVIVTENGIATGDDRRRIDFVRSALAGVHRAISDGVPVEGYFHWSSLDNFEWALGYGPTFGLIGVDRKTQERHVKPSARWLGQIARFNAL